MDYAFLPPEINSARMYSGPGPSSLLAAARNWEVLATELSCAAENYSSTLSCLTNMYWFGPTSAMMLATTAPFVNWLNATSAATRQTANQAKAAVTAFEQAYAMTVPPALIATNRAELRALIASNFVGQNTPAIAATETTYTEMWAQDAVAMYYYAGSSAMAATLAPFTQPPQTTNPGGLAAQAAGITANRTGGGIQKTLTQFLSAVPKALQGLSMPQLTPAEMQEFIDLVNSFVSITNSGVTILNTLFATLNAAHFGQTAATEAVELGPALANALGPVVSALKASGLAGAVAAGLGQADRIGQLAVPPSWSVPTNVSVKALSGNGLTTLAGVDAAESSMLGVPGMPVAANRGSTGTIPRYGSRLTVMPRPPAAG